MTVSFLYLLSSHYIIKGVKIYWLFTKYLGLRLLERGKCGLFFEHTERGWDKSPSLSIVFGLSSPTLSQINLVYPCLSRSIKPIPTLLKQMGSLSSSFQEPLLLLDGFDCFSRLLDRSQPHYLLR